MKNQALFSSTDKSKTIKCRLLQFFWLKGGRSHMRPIDHMCCRPTAYESERYGTAHVT